VPKERRWEEIEKGVELAGMHLAERTLKRADEVHDERVVELFQDLLLIQDVLDLHARATDFGGMIVRHKLGFIRS
jgi:hypothetical protein